MTKVGLAHLETILWVSQISSRVISSLSEWKIKIDQSTQAKGREEPIVEIALPEQKVKTALPGPTGLDV